MKCRVYKLVDPFTMKPRYVGQTKCNGKARLRWHIKPLNNLINRGVRLSPVQQWLLDLKKVGKRPILIIIDHNAIWDITEAVHIDRLRREGYELLNRCSVVS